MDHLKVSTGTVRGQLAGLTMLLKRTRDPIGPRRAPWRINWMDGGFANYYLDDELAQVWRRIRGLETTPSEDPRGSPPDSATSSSASPLPTKI